MKQQLISLSGVFESESFLPKGAELLDMRSLEGTCCYCCDEAAEVLSKAITSGRGLCWIDTGDYHYLTLFRASLLDEPFELILLDNHTDDFDVCGMLSCGNWVTELVARTGCKSTLIRRGEDYVADNSDLPVFISLDLDVLREEDFRTNWDQGTLSEAGLQTILEDIFRTRKVLGMDICGGITESKGAEGCDLAGNLAFRNRLLAFLSGYFSL